LIMGIGHRKEIRKLTFQALALRWIRSDEGLTLETSAFESLYTVANSHYQPS